MPKVSAAQRPIPKSNKLPGAPINGKHGDAPPKALNRAERRALAARFKITGL